MTAVGDDLQAIYGWRSASAEHILELPGSLRRHDGGDARAQLPLLAADPRTPPTRRRAGRRARIRKQLRSEREGGARPELIFCRDESAQAGEVCERVLEARERGMDLRRQAVLMRTSHDSDLLELELTRREIPFVKYGGLRYLEAGARQGSDRAVPARRQPGNELSWFRVLQLLDGVGPVTARRALDVLLSGSRRAIWRPGPEARERLPASARATARRAGRTRCARRVGRGPPGGRPRALRTRSPR